MIPNIRKRSQDLCWDITTNIRKRRQDLCWDITKANDLSESDESQSVNTENVDQLAAMFANQDINDNANASINLCWDIIQIFGSEVRIFVGILLQI